MIVFAVWGLGQRLGGLSRGRGLKFFWLFNVTKAIKRLTMALKNIYSWPKKLYQFIANVFFLVNTLTSGRVLYRVEINLALSCLIVGRLAYVTY